MISFIFSRFLRTDLLMLVLPVFLISFNNDNGSKTAKGISFLISSAMISFIYSRFYERIFFLMLVLPVLLISFNNDNGSKTAKGISFLISSATFGGSLSAYGADIKKSILSDTESTVLLIGLEGFLHLCTMGVAR